jgi:hypothetical protein
MARHQTARELSRVNGGRVDPYGELIECPKSIGYANMPHAPPSDTPVVQGGAIIAKEGKRHLVHSGDKIEAIYLDPTKRYSEKIEPGCNNRLAPTIHATRLDELVDAAAGKKGQFERGLKNVLKSNPFGNQRVIWRLEFEGEHGLNCGRIEQEEICARLNILSFLDLECTVSSSSNQTGEESSAVVVSNIAKETQRTATSAEVDSPSPSVTELEHCTELRGRPMQERGKVRFVEETTRTARHEHLVDACDGDADVPPGSQLRMLSELGEGSVYIFDAGFSGIEVASSALKLHVWLLKRHMERMHSGRGDICKPTEHADVSFRADNLQEHCCRQADRNMKVVLEGLKNIALVFAPVIGLIYSRGSWPLSL